MLFGMDVAGTPSKTTNKRIHEIMHVGYKISLSLIRLTLLVLSWKALVFKHFGSVNLVSKDQFFFLETLKVWLLDRGRRV